MDISRRTRRCDRLKKDTSLRISNELFEVFGERGRKLRTPFAVARDIKVLFPWDYRRGKRKRERRTMPPTNYKPHPALKGGCHATRGDTII